MAYYTYASESKGYLADAQPASLNRGWSLQGTKTFTLPNGSQHRARAFVGEPRDETGAFRNINLQDQIRGFQVGAMWPYMGSSDIFHCPIDRRYNAPPTSPYPAANNTIGGYRTYSLGGVLSAAFYGITTTGEGDYVAIKYSEFNNPGSKITFLEEQAGDGHNDNTWNVYLNTPQWWDPFAIVHNGASTFAYADGHAERHKWTDKNMIEYAATGAKNAPVDTTSDDYNWFRRAYIPGRPK